MRFFEVLDAKFFLASDKKLKASDQRPSTRNAVKLPSGMENALDEYRPDHIPSRIGAVFLRTDMPTGNYVYEVRAIGGSGKGHTGWLKALAGMTDSSMIEDRARGFWDGDDYIHDEGVWEYWAPAVQIVSCVKKPAEESA